MIGRAAVGANRRISVLVCLLRVLVSVPYESEVISGMGVGPLANECIFLCVSLAMIGKVGLDGLPKQVKTVMPEMDLGQEMHRRRFEETMSGFMHGSDVDDTQMSRMYEAQTLWDEYMAETASK